MKFFLKNLPLTSVLGMMMLLLVSCSNSTNSDQDSNFDRSKMLENYGNNIILPSYKNLQNAITNLQSSAETFANESTGANLQKLQDNLKKARLAWQDTSPFQFGPAGSVLLRTSLNTYPANVTKINDNISSGDYTPGTAANTDAEGFPTLGYLLHGVGSSNQEILSMYTDDAEAEKRTAYLIDNIAFIKELVDATLADWQSAGGDYIGMFLSEENSGTDVGSSLGMLINSFLTHYERFMRDGKIGIPSGILSAGVPRPTNTEAYYGGYSVELAIANLRAIQRLFLGTGLNGSKGVGLEENLKALNAESLSNEIKSQLDKALAALERLNDPLAQQIENDNEVVLSAYQELHRLVALFKADMASVLGITITYQDNDGD